MTGSVRGPRAVASFLLGRLGRREAARWVFGNGKGFRDNPRYLAEYVVHECPAIQAWWIARTPGEARRAARSGLRVAVRETSEARSIQRSAGVAFLSNGFQDLEPEHLAGAYVVDLRHGKGLKRVLLDLPVASGTPGVAAKARAALRRWRARRRLAEVDMIVAPGEMAAEMYRSAYSGPASRIRVLGTPRFDVIQGGAAFKRAGGQALRGELGLAEDDYVVLWLPTWREVGDAAWFPRLAREDFDRVVADTNIVLLVKPHPFSEVGVFHGRMPSHPRLRLLEEGDHDANCLLRISDALVTDFSSAAFDFALLDRPIHFLVPDIDDYRGGKGLYMPFERVSGGDHHLNWPALLPEIRRAALQPKSDDRAAAARIRALARHRDEPGSCARIVAAVTAEVGMVTASARQNPVPEHAAGRGRTP